jgi:hypothetical protein
MGAAGAEGRATAGEQLERRSRGRCRGGGAVWSCLPRVRNYTVRQCDQRRRAPRASAGLLHTGCEPGTRFASRVSRLAAFTRGSLRARQRLQLPFRVSACRRGVAAEPPHPLRDAASAPLIVLISLAVIVEAELEAARWANLVRGPASDRVSRRLRQAWEPAYRAYTHHV